MDCEATYHPKPPGRRRVETPALGRVRETHTYEGTSALTVQDAGDHC